MLIALVFFINLKAQVTFLKLITSTFNNSIAEINSSNTNLLNIVSSSTFKLVKDLTFLISSNSQRQRTTLKTS